MFFEINIHLCTAISSQAREQVPVNYFLRVPLACFGSMEAAVKLWNLPNKRFKNLFYHSFSHLVQCLLYEAHPPPCNVQEGLERARTPSR